MSADAMTDTAETIIRIEGLAVETTGAPPTPIRNNVSFDSG
jgi:hypothetical protein